MSQALFKLNIGCGIEWREEYLNVDIYPLEDLIQQARAYYPDTPDNWLPGPGVEVVQWDLCQPWPWLSSGTNEIMAENLLEHFTYSELDHVLREAMRVLMPGGVMWGRVPDFAEVWRRCVEDLDYDFLPFLGQGPYPYPGENALHNFCYAWGHKQIFTWRMLVNWFQTAGFWLEEPVRDNGHVWMAFRAWKPGGSINDDATATGAAPRASGAEDIPSSGDADG